MALFENPLGFISGIVHEHNLDKWARLVLACVMAAFGSYYIGYGVSAPLVFKAGLPIVAAEFLGRCAGCVLMGSAVILTWKKNAPKGAELVLPGPVQDALNKEP
jgi:hypothetical protein